jgi:hypothetical protein
VCNKNVSPSIKSYSGYNRTMFHVYIWFFHMLWSRICQILENLRIYCSNCSYKWVPLDWVGLGISPGQTKKTAATNLFDFTWEMFHTYIFIVSKMWLGDKYTKSHLTENKQILTKKNQLLTQILNRWVDCNKFALANGVNDLKLEWISFFFLLPQQWPALTAAREANIKLRS